MASITIRNVGDTVIHRLRARAAEHGRSMEDEALVILRDVVGGDTPPRDLAAAIRKRVAAVGTVELDVADREPMRKPVRFA